MSITTAARVASRSWSRAATWAFLVGAAALIILQPHSDGGVALAGLGLVSARYAATGKVLSPGLGRRPGTLENAAGLLLLIAGALRWPVVAPFAVMVPAIAVVEMLARRRGWSRAVLTRSSLAIVTLAVGGFVYLGSRDQSVMNWVDDFWSGI
jgi:hypothetical protein